MGQAHTGAATVRPTDERLGSSRQGEISGRSSRTRRALDRRRGREGVRSPWRWLPAGDPTSPSSTLLSAAHHDPFQRLAAEPVDDFHSGSREEPRTRTDEDLRLQKERILVLYAHEPFHFEAFFTQFLAQTIRREQRIEMTMFVSARAFAQGPGDDFVDGVENEHAARFQ